MNKRKIPRLLPYITASLLGISAQSQAQPVEVWQLRGVPLQQVENNCETLDSVSQDSTRVYYFPACNILAYADGDSLYQTQRLDTDFESIFEPWFIKYWRNDGTEEKKFDPFLSSPEDTLRNVYYYRPDSEQFYCILLEYGKDRHIVTEKNQKTGTTIHLEKE
jgi:hypothetical protein